jgi:endogenous inhibitor of DNA gyrase (YacG/DUF329 family)
MSKCPICKKPTDPKFTPFCSQRCADVDLGRWLTESYSVPAKPPAEEAEDEE